MKLSHKHTYQHTYTWKQQQNQEKGLLRVLLVKVCLTISQMQTCFHVAVLQEI